MFWTQHVLSRSGTSSTENGVELFGGLLLLAMLTLAVAVKLGKRRVRIVREVHNMCPGESTLICAPQGYGTMDPFGLPQPKCQQEHHLTIGSSVAALS